jgi:hypothetical protein
MTTFLSTLISQYNDRLKCEPVLITPFIHCPFFNHVPKFSNFVCTKNCNIVFKVHHNMQILELQVEALLTTFEFGK